MCRSATDLPIVVILCLVLAGCAHGTDAMSLRHRQALEWAHQGEKDYLNGKMAQSRQHYEKALQLNTTIENINGIAANLLSLAQIHLDLGEYDLAEIKLQSILDNRDASLAPDLRVEAAARYAQLALILKQADKADQLAQQALTLCVKCSLEAVILNLQAQTAYAQADLEKSAKLAQQAGASAENQPIELANAWRLLAEIRLRQGAAADAVLWLEKTLTIDKQLGLPKKIIADLRLMAEAYDQLGQHEVAASWRSRERAIRQALGEKLATREKLP